MPDLSDKLPAWSRGMKLCQRELNPEGFTHLERPQNYCCVEGRKEAGPGQIYP